MNRAVTLALILLLLRLAFAGDEEDAREARFPVALVVHGGYRPTMETDITLYKLAITSYLYSFFGQFEKTPREALEAYIWVDASSYEDHIDTLEGVLHNLQGLIEEVNQDYHW
ncbi:hypothetical protein MMC08_007764, partial [Hypocenomyce scalaris]|nr:hypothetical protein [Hypocenomyce scalaris]